MAEETKTNPVETTDNNVTEKSNVVDSVSKAEYEKLKTALDKALKEKGDITKQLRAKQSEDERLAEEQAEAQRIREEELETLKAENNRMKAANAYKSISSEKAVENLIEAVSNADHNAIAKIFEAEIEARIKAEKTEWLKSRPQVNVGNDETITREQIMSIKDPIERQEMMSKHIELFRK